MLDRQVQAPPLQTIVLTPRSCCGGIVYDAMRRALEKNHQCLRNISTLVVIVVVLVVCQNTLKNFTEKFFNYLWMLYFPGA